MRVEKFYQALENRKIDFFTGVPDSLLKNFCSYITDNTQNHIMAANEGGAVGIAAGYHLATGKISCVYMQNSGQGNSANPLISLADSDVYSIPTLLLIGWRGKPGIKDEPQHVKQGKITLSLLDSMQIPYKVINSETSDIEAILDKAVNYMTERNAPYAIVAEKGTFEKYTLQSITTTPYDMSREDAISIVTESLSPRDVIISTTGKASRELFEYREKHLQGHEKDFLTVGSMGHSSQIALGIAKSIPNRQVYCFDGDGAAIMHLGGLAIIGSESLTNYKHIILNNAAHDSVGGQPTVANKIDFSTIAKSCGYKYAYDVRSKKELESKIEEFISCNGPALLEIKVKKGAREDLGRPTTTPIENKKAFMEFLK